MREHKAVSLTKKSLLIAAVVAIGIASGRAAEPLLEKQDVFTAGKGGYYSYRIPGITVTPKGTILVHCEARTGGGDWTKQDVCLRRSSDSGKSWTDVRIMTGEPKKTVVHNAVCVVDSATGFVHMQYNIAYTRMFHIISKDEGETWSDPVEITKCVERYRKDYKFNIVGNGCGHGIQLTKGPHAGRMLIACWFSTGGRRHRPSDLGIIYSDDSGKNWHSGGWIARNRDISEKGHKIVNPSETTLVELSDGSVMANIRTESKIRRRLMSISKDGGVTWAKPRFQQELPEPVCMSSTLRLPDGSILYSNPNSTKARRDVTVRLSRDDGKTWPVSRRIQEGSSGYSDLSILPDGTLLCFYERGGDKMRVKFLTLARFNIEWLSGK